MRQWMPSVGLFFAALLLLCLGGTTRVAADDTPAPLPKSAKERLSDKASDEQRVNNCRVPLDRRGSKPRPDCPPVQAGETPTSDTAAVAR
jgi:hypothetical protein